VGKRLRTNKKTKQRLKAWIPAGVYPREGGDGNDREERLRRKIHIMKSHFGDEERLRGKREFGEKEKMRDKYIFMKSHFGKRRETSGKKYFGQIHICEVSLRGERLRRKRDFADEERLRRA